MAIYRIAGFYVQMEGISPIVQRQCAPYRIEALPENASVLHIDKCSLNTDGLSAEGGCKNEIQLGNIEFLAIYREICAYALAHDAFLMHCAVIEYEGRGYAFSAPSGTGKTTHIRLWQRVFGADKVTIVNGDKPILRVINDVVYAYGTPWCGKEGYNTNTRVPLCGLCFIERGKENRIRPMSTEEAVPHLFRQIMVADSTNLARQMELADQLLEKVPCYLLSCNTDPDAAVTAYTAMNSNTTGGNHA